MNTSEKTATVTGMTKIHESLKSKLKFTDLEIQHYVRALEVENLKCIKKIAKLQAEKVTYNNRVKVLEKHLKDSGPSLFDIVKLSDEQPTN